jgi:HD-like signal output (HDOD) protein
MANSIALNPGGQEVVDVKTAILRAGTETVRAISFAIAMKQMLYGKEMLVFGDLPKRLWEHSACTAALCRSLGKRLCKSNVNEDEAMFAGLVHDIGAFYLLFRAVQFPDLVEDEVELQALLVDWHDSIGHSLLSALGMPENVLLAVQEHEQTRQITEVNTLSDLLYVANKFANLLSPWHKAIEENESDILAELFDAETLQTLLDETETEVNALKQALGV